MPADNNAESKNATDESDIEIIVDEETKNNGADENYIISDADVLYKFVRTTLELRDLVKCPLCLDVMTKPVEISCSHYFCEECLDNYFQFEEHPDKPLCPVCRKLINKRSRIANESLLGYISFINDVNKELKNCLDCEVTQLCKRSNINKQLGLPNTPTPVRKRAVSVSSVTDVIPGTFHTPKKRGRPPKCKQHEKPTIKNIETPGSHQKIKKNGNSDSIIHWLTDNKNIFDKISQSQQSASSKCSQESFDMPSVSQIKNKKRAGHVNARPRSSSLSVENEIIYIEPRVRHNSWPSENGKLDNFLIDEEHLLLVLEETRKAAELRQKEEEFLNSIENELEMQKKIEEPQEIKKKRKRKSETNEKVDKRAKKLNALVPTETENTVVHQKEVVEAYLPKITNNGVDFQEVQPKFNKPVEKTVVVLEQNNVGKTAPKVVELFDKNYLDEDYIFKTPTQKVPSPQRQETDTEKLFIELQKCVEKIQLLSCVTENCRLLKQYAANIQAILLDEQSLKSQKLSDVQNSKRATSDAETQTDLMLVDAAVQADEKQNERSTPASTVLSEPFNGSLISKLVLKYGKDEQLKKVSQHTNSLSASSDVQELLNKQLDEKKDKISNTFDSIDFDTQQLIQKYNRLLSNSPQNSAVDVEKNSVSRRLDYSENQGESQKKKFKRIRAPSDSDSDSEVLDRKRNKYLQEDISVQFESEVPVTIATRNTDDELKLSDDATYSVFVDKILKKYDKPPVSTQFEKPTANKPLEQLTDKPTEVIERCERIIQQVEKHTAPTLKINQSVDVNRNSKTQREKHVFSSDETFNDEDILQAIDRDIEEIQKMKSSKQNGLSESLLGYSNKAVDTTNGNKVQNNELNDSFDEEIALLEPDDVTVVENKQNGIKVLHNVVLKPDLPEEIAASDEEIFSDIDVVEDSPPRNGAHFDEPLDVILPPPPEFQEEINSKNLTTLTATYDFNTEQDMIDKTLTEQMKIGSATPDFLSPPPLRSDRIKVMGTSTPISGKAHSEKSLNLSPIAFQRNTNPFEAAKSIKESPLTVVANAPPVVVVDRNIVDSTPKQQQQSILHYIKPVSQESVVVKKPCITCTRLENEHMIAVSALANKKLAVYTSSFGPSVTHVVVAVNEKNCVKDHTMKYVSGVAAGIWIVSFKWVQKCLAQNKIVPEEPYEVKDVSGLDGPRQSRLTRTKNPLLGGFKIYAAPPFLSTTPADVDNVVKMLGGTVVSKPDALANKQGHICVIISEASASQDFEIYESWLENYKVITVDIEWLSRSVGQYKIMSLRPFALCSEDLLDNLGYPENMICSMHSTISDNT